MQHLLASPPARPWPLYGVSATRTLETRWLAQLPAHSLMARAGDAVFRLGRALYPHARQVWVACGGGNNGGDGLVAALAWHRHCQVAGGRVSVGWFGHPDRLPDDARAAWQALQAAGVPLENTPPPHTDLAIDALLGIGVQRALDGALATCSTWLQTTATPTLCVDLPSGLDADRGHWWGPAPARPAGPRHTLSLLTLKPGLFTADGRDAVGDLWFDDLGTGSGDATPPLPPTAWLHGPAHAPLNWRQAHTSHKGSRGNVVVIGGQDVAHNGNGMTGAALLAARAALRHGAGRVYVGLLAPHGGPGALSLDSLHPELMFRSPAALAPVVAAPDAVTVCGCGGGEAVAAELPALLADSPTLVLDADALNVLARQPGAQALVAARRARGQSTVLTPHPLEAARLLGTSAQMVQDDRLAAAQRLAEGWQCTVVLKGSGTVVATPDATPRINPSGNGLLATAGTGDVLAGLIGAHLAQQPHGRGMPLEQTVADAVLAHGLAADRWPDRSVCLTASDLYAA